MMYTGLNAIPSSNYSCIEEEHFNNIQSFSTTRADWKSLDLETRRFISKQIPHYASVIAKHTPKLDQKNIQSKLEEWI